MSRIPLTDVRLQPYITVRVPDAGGEGQEQIVGSISKVTWEVTRDVNVWRQLRAEDKDPGLAQEVYPSTLPVYTLTFTKVVLYKETFMEAFGLTATGEGYDILGQRKAVDVKIQLLEPADLNTMNQVTTDNSSVTVTITFKNVWFKNLPFEFDIEAGDLKTTQDVEGMATHVEVSKPS